MMKIGNGNKVRFINIDKLTNENVHLNKAEIALQIKMCTKSINE